MSLSTISIQLDEKTAKIYSQASMEQREKLGLLISLWLREFGKLTLTSLMDKISDQVQQCDQTSDILDV